MSDKEILTLAVEKAIKNGWNVIGSATERYCPVCNSPESGTVNGYVSTSGKFCSEHGVKIEERIVAGHWRIKEYDEHILNGDKHLCLTYHTGEWRLPDSHSDTIPVYELIFNHDFARALWGEDEERDDLNFVTKMAWKGYLEQMVLEDNPIQYLGKNI